MEEKQKITDKQMSNQVGSIIDDLANAGKKAVRKFFNLMVERTSDTTDDLVDKGVDKIKHKIDKKGSDDGQKQKD